MRTYCAAQGTVLSALSWPKWEGHPKTEAICILLLFSSSIVSDFLQPHGLQHSRLPCPSLSPRVCSDSCPLSWWCYPTISSPSPFDFSLSHHQWEMSQFFVSGGQSIGVSASASVLPMNIQGWFRLYYNGLQHNSLCLSLGHQLMSLRSNWAELKAFPLWPGLWGWAEVNWGSFDSSHTLI